MQTEKATYEPDLPHKFKGVGDVCECGRDADDQLHQTQVRETASAQTTLQRENGT